MNFIKYLILLIAFSGCSFSQNKKVSKVDNDDKTVIDSIISLSKEDKVKEKFLQNDDYKAAGFDFPVGKPNAKGYYNAQSFGKNNHLGDDWNAVTGGNSDLGDPIYSTANGYVNFTEDIKGGWGKVIRIWHLTIDGKIIESLYAHCDKILVTKGTFVKKGQKIGTIGNADGQYLAHLHFEMRDNINLSIGQGYSLDDEGYIDPTKFIKQNRK